MKKQIVLIAAAFAALFTVSCTKETPLENTPVQGGMYEVTITASVDQETKTAYDAAGAFSWHKGDQISVKGSDNVFHTLTAQGAGATATFKGWLPEGVTLKKHAFFPADPNHGVNSSSYNYSLPEYKDLTATGSADIPMSSYVSDGVYNFKHMTGAALLTFTNVPSNVVSVEISVKANSLRLSGVQEVWSGSPFSWTGAAAASESEKTFTRKVLVKDNQAQLYLPYKGELWDQCTVNIKGFDASGNELVLLKDKTMSGRGSSVGVFEAGVVVPYAALELPVVFSTLDWTNATTYTGTSALTSVKYFADSKFLYLQLLGSASDITESGADRLTFFLYDVLDGTTGDGFWGNFNGSKGNVEIEEQVKFAEGYALNVKLDDKTVSSEVNEKAGVVTWTFALPRTINVLKDAGKAYFGLMLQDNAGNARGSVPSTSESLLEVTLP